MEFHAVARVRTSQKTLQDRLTVTALGDICTDFSAVAGTADAGEADTPWGHFNLVRTLFTGGVRFQLTNCPNGLQWTVTTGYPPEPEHVFVHATINRLDIDPDFGESLQDFVDSMKDGLEKVFFS